MISGKIDFGSVEGKFSYEAAEMDEEHIGRWLQKYYARTPVGVPWGKMFKADIIHKYRLRFDENMKVGEDHVFTMSYLIHCHKMSVLSYSGYHYFHENNMVSKYFMNETEALGFKDKVLTAYSKMAEKFVFDEDSFFIFQNTYFPLSHFLNYQSIRYKYSFQDWIAPKETLKALSLRVSEKKYTKGKIQLLITLLMSLKLYSLLLLLVRFAKPLLKTS